MFSCGIFWVPWSYHMGVQNISALTPIFPPNHLICNFHSPCWSNRPTKRVISKKYGHNVDLKRFRKIKRKDLKWFTVRLKCLPMRPCLIKQDSIYAICKSDTSGASGCRAKDILVQTQNSKHSKLNITHV